MDTTSSSPVAVPPTRSSLQTCKISTSMWRERVHVWSTFCELLSGASPLLPLLLMHSTHHATPGDNVHSTVATPNDTVRGQIADEM